MTPTTTANVPAGVTVSAPGKILLAGGYLVLEAPNAGFVIAADKRFYTSVIRGDTSTNEIEENDKSMHIRVKSPQFRSEWNYMYDESNCHLVSSPSNESVNPFVEKSLRVCLIYLLRSSPSTTNTPTPSFLDVLIRADNDFYSVLPHLPEDSKKTPAEVAALPKFLPCPVDPETGKVVVHKTGLGSSAALTTSLVGALVHFFRKDSQEGKALSGIIHNLAQICHCHAQGKVGSGFDVSAACHGTHVYRRFPKCLLPDLLQQLDHFEKETSTDTDTQHVILSETVKRSVELVPWKEDMVTQLNLPSDLQLLLADVRGGSESPSMARTVLKWKSGEQSKNDANEVPHWSALSRLNPKIVESILSLSKEAADGTTDFDALSKLPASQWPSDNDSPLISLRDTFSEIRNELRSMGEAAVVPIEPPPQQQLCDATSKLPGVVTALVPGAGGYDAVACLYINRPEVVKSIGELWSTWKSPVVCPLAVRAGDEGLRVETSN
mmetsp:Transcript_37671/g.78917  ORF Transcript_37671/g.78917 Transcript_37671/m.78917 type:complete len:494 (-) Transcript_37671:400-1881(-)|eukprot:CAMPEP_0201208224 /NCGR_PEP_ID=MMETSP0851-20130426/176014_1 /ASSEMBLY_ACC=CAM_ASM_000631 /TAXON_ID=183588 /ORGANISM="Pseudo-nitzschia fraudulenta, Strain WWA7" /LENGTH=493 /DNA_ID=CAMNT_0047496753 /DNA_START=87 /DNA_END=1568 /DNA_ORIENTATION=+